MELIENYLVFCILGKVKSDKEKLCFLNQWMKCYALLYDFLADCGTKTISSDQTFCKIKSIKDKNYPKITHTKASTGGLMKWSEKNNRDICTKHLETVLKQIETAAQACLPLQEWVVMQFPKIDTFVEFWQNEVLARIEAVNNLNRNGENDFIFRLSGSSDVTRGLPANQSIDIFISQRYAKMKGEKLDSFVREVGRLANAAKISMTNMPVSIIEKIHGVERIRSLIWSTYGDIRKCDFKPNPAGNEWVKLQKKE